MIINTDVLEQDFYVLQTKFSETICKKTYEHLEYRLCEKSNDIINN